MSPGFRVSRPGTEGFTQTEHDALANPHHSNANDHANVILSHADTAHTDAPILKALVTTKGDIIGATAASTPARVAIGADGLFLKADSAAAAGVSWAAGGAGAPTDADYLVGTANAGLSGEIVVGITPGGELGGTWAAPTVDATHSGSAHLALATNAIVLGTTAAAGAAATTLRSNDTIVAFDITAPATQAFGDAAVVGVAAVATRRDHKHAMPALGTGALDAAAGNHTTPAMSATVAGHVPTPPNNTTTFLRGDGTFAAPPAGSGATKISGNTGAFAADTTWETLTADSAGITVTTPTTVMTLTGLGAGTYRVKGTLIWKTAATATGIGIVLNHTGTLTQFVSTWWTTTTGGAAATGVADQVTIVNGGQMVEGKSERVKDTVSSFLAGTDTAGGTQLSILEAVLIVSVSGDLQLKIATEVAASAATLLAGSSIEVNKTV